MGAEVVVYQQTVLDELGWLARRFPNNLIAWAASMVHNWQYADQLLN